MSSHEDKQNVFPSKEFLKRRGLSPDGAVYVRVLLETLQHLRFTRQFLKSQDVLESVEDLEEYIENEIVFIRHAEAKDLDDIIA